MQKSQTSTEYLVILTVVIIIALVAINTMSGFPGIGANSVKKVSELKLQTDTVGIESYSIGTNSSLFKLKNNYFDTITVIEFRVNQQSNLTCNSSNTVPSLPVVLNVGQSMIINCSIINSTSYTITTKQTPVVGISYTDILGATRTAGNVQNYGTVSSGNGQSGSPQVSWWNSSYAYRKQINITTSVNLTSDYTATITLDTASLVSGGKLQASGNDLRIIYDNDGVYTELDRINETTFNSASARISFNLVSAANVASAELTKYYIYYGNSSSANPPSNTGNVYLFYDDFNSGSLNMSKWEVSKRVGSAASVSIENQAVRLSTPDVPNMIAIITLSELPTPLVVKFKFYTVHAWDFPAVTTRSDNVGCGYNYGIGNGMQFAWHDTNRFWITKGTSGTCASGWQGTSLVDIRNMSLPYNTFNNFTITDDGTNLKMYYNTVNLVVNASDNTTFAMNRVSFTTRDFNYQRYFDDIVITRFATSTPSYVLGSEENKP
jgi:hypothetical protein